MSEWIEPLSGSTGALSSVSLPAPRSLDWFGASQAKANVISIINNNFFISSKFYSSSTVAEHIDLKTLRGAKFISHL